MYMYMQVCSDSSGDLHVCTCKIEPKTLQAVFVCVVCVVVSTGLNQIWGWFTQEG